MGTLFSHHSGINILDSTSRVTLWVDVSECEAQVVLVDDLGRDLLGHDLVEERGSRWVDRGVRRGGYRGSIDFIVIATHSALNDESFVAGRKSAVCQ